MDKFILNQKLFKLNLNFPKSQTKANNNNNNNNLAATGLGSHGEE
jgi:hypothetical protein